MTVLFAVPEEVTPPADVSRESKLLTVSGVDSDQDSAVSVKRHSSMISYVVSSKSPPSEHTAQRSSAATHLRTSDAASASERRLPRRATTRRAKLSRKSTRRILERNISEFDDDNDPDVDGGEELAFSETDSETNDNENASGSCDSDLEFETELARQMNVSQVRRARLVTSHAVGGSYCF